MKSKLHQQKLMLATTSRRSVAEPEYYDPFSQIEQTAFQGKIYSEEDTKIRISRQGKQLQNNS